MRTFHAQITALITAVITVYQPVVCMATVNAAGQNSSTLIPSAYVQVAQDYGIPPAVFYSVMMQESTKKIKIQNGARSEDKYLPWPWTLNVELKSYYFSSKDEAKTALRQFIATNNKRIAVGIGQIYLPSHGHLFDDVTLLLEPGINLQYAAKLLADNFRWTLDQGKPNWWVAVGRYHTPSRLDLAVPYREAAFKRCEKTFGDCTRYGGVYGI